MLWEKTVLWTSPTCARPTNYLFCNVLPSNSTSTFSIMLQRYIAIFCAIWWIFSGLRIRFLSLCKFVLFLSFSARLCSGRSCGLVWVTVAVCWPCWLWLSRLAVPRLAFMHHWAPLGSSGEHCLTESVERKLLDTRDKLHQRPSE